MMLYTSDVVTLHGIEGTQASNKVVHGQNADALQASKLDALLAEFKNVFGKPGKPVGQMIDHKIKLLDPSAALQCHHLYCMSEDKLKAVKSTFTDYFAKEWI